MEASGASLDLDQGAMQGADAKAISTGGFDGSDRFAAGRAPESFDPDQS